MGQTLLMLGGIVGVWGVLLWMKWRVAKRLSRHGAFVLRHLSVPIQFGFFVFSVSIASQILPKEVARHPYMRYGVRLALIFALFWILDRLLSVLLRRSANLGGGGRDLVHTLGRSVLFGVSALIVCDTLGISITPILASLGVGSVAVALALQGTLGDFFSGIYLIVDRPVRMGDFVRMDSGIEGQVLRIGWRSTELFYFGRMVVVPNSKLATSVLTNLSLPDRAYLFKIEVGVSYASDLAKVRAVLEDEVAKAGAVEPKVRFTQFGDSAVTTEVLAKAPDFDAHFGVRSALIEGVHRRFKAEGIEIPFPQRVLHQKG